MGNGWIKLHRQMIDWEWYLDDKVFRVFLHILLSANHAPKKWRGIMVESGQWVTSRTHLSEELRLGEQSVRTALTKLKSTGEITIKTTNKYTVITVNKWKNYQQLTSNPTNDQPTTNQQLTTNKNDKKNKNENKPMSWKQYNENKHYEDDSIQLGELEGVPEVKHATPSTVSFMALFRDINPMWKTWFRVPTQHQSSRQLLELHDFNWWKNFMPKYKQWLESDLYATKATSPFEMVKKIAAIELSIKAKISGAKPKQEIWI